ncbi:hypothetical protein ACIRBX_25020 [Kitasatospora sp. NPDC096147]|uniref:hypothetical protein n=1 Tax=Kitasatospora sp. NPDC096147 TaxID=3364093 RepID=UPI00382ABD67
MSKTTLPPMPAALAARPMDPRRKLPIPAVNEVLEDGTGDFVVIQGDTALRLATQGRCALCGQLMGGGSAAFIGGPASAESGLFTDPPMHEACAEAALRLCPHMARQHARRASERRVPEGSTIPAGFSEEKPQEWVMVLAPLYGAGVTAAADGGLVPLFRALGEVRKRRFGYEGGVLVERADG